MAWVLALGFPIALLLAGLGGYPLARKALAPVDAMTVEAERLSQRLPVENPRDELGKLAGVFNGVCNPIDNPPRSCVAGTGRFTASGTKRRAQEKLVGAILPIQLKVKTIAEAIAP